MPCCSRGRVVWARGCSPGSWPTCWSVSGACHLVQAGSHPDIKMVEPDEPGKQLKVEQIRALGSDSVLTAQESGFRVFVIDPADAMNTAAANALLKTLEEPVPSTLLILVSSHPHRLPATIISRCQRVQFQPPSPDEGMAWLGARGVDPAHAARLLALFGGAPFSAQSWKSQQLDVLLGWIVLWLSDLLRLQASGSPAGPSSIRDHTHLQSLAKGIDSKAVHLYLDQVQEMRRQLVRNLNPELVLESLLVDWARLSRKR